MKKMLVFCLLMICYSSFSQTKNNENKYWADFGIGGTGNDNLAINVSLNLVKNKSIYKFRFIGVSEFLIFEQSESSSNTGVLYGRHFSNKYFQISFLGGLGLTQTIEKGEIIGSIGSGWFTSVKYEMNTFNAMSIPLEIEFYFKPLKFIGLGISLFGDINQRNSTFGVALKIGFGKFR